MFNFILTENARVWFNDLPKGSIDSYDDLKEAFLENYLQQKKCIKDLVEIHNIKQREGNPRKSSCGGHTTDECMHLKRQIEEMLKARKLSRLIKELKQSNGKDQTKAEKRGNLRKGKTDGNTDGEEDGTEGPMIIEAEMGGHFVHRMYVDGGSSSHCDEEHSTSAWINFMIVRSPSPYNGIIGRTGVRRIQAVPSTTHGMLKFPVTCKMITLRSSIIIPLECTMVSRPGAQQPVIDQVTEEKIQVAIHPEYPEQTIVICSTLTEEGRKELCGLLRLNLDIFAWKPSDMIGVSHHIAKHRLNIHEGCLSVRQKKKGHAAERHKAIYEEVEKLVDADIMKEVHYHSWLSNPVMVKKHDGS
nr:reverse transcriptase domain-containing protein [Tanacetum cinerariifolium]